MVGHDDKIVQMVMSWISIVNRFDTTIAAISGCRRYSGPLTAVSRRRSMVKNTRPDAVAHGKGRLGGRLSCRRHVMNVGLPMQSKWGRRRARKAITNDQWAPSARFSQELGPLDRLPIGPQVPNLPHNRGQLYQLQTRLSPRLQPSILRRRGKCLNRSRASRL